MKYQPYPKYKDSGVEWIGEIPEGWTTLALGKILVGVKDGTHGTFSRTSVGFPLLSAKNVFDDCLLVGDDESLVSQEDFVSITANGFPARGDILLTIVGTIGRACVFDEPTPVAFQRSVAFLRPAVTVNSRFLTKVVQASPFQEQLKAFTKASAQGGVYLGEVVQCKLALPGNSTQTSIAAFLDRETAKIDTLVRDYEDLIALLTEKRQALISHAVTRGLSELVDANDPEFGESCKPVRFRDSGVEWLGEIPEEWKRGRVLRFARLETGHTPDKQRPEYWTETDGIPWVSLNDTKTLQSNDYITDTAFHTTPDGLANSSAHLIPSRAVVFTRDATIGACSIMVTEMAVSQHIIAWVCSNSLHPEYLLYSFRAMIQELEKRTFGATIKTIGMADVKSLEIAVPPFSEQTAIAQFIARETTKIDTLVRETQEAIELLREHRSALISAAVTGKINVEGLC